MDLLNQILTWHISSRKLCRAIPPVSGAAEDGAEVVLQVAAQMQAERAGGIADLSSHNPEALRTGISAALRLEPVEIPDQDLLNGFEKGTHQRAPVEGGSIVVPVRPLCSTWQPPVHASAGSRSTTHARRRRRAGLVPAVR